MLVVATELEALFAGGGERAAGKDEVFARGLADRRRVEARSNRLRDSEAAAVLGPDPMRGRSRGERLRPPPLRAGPVIKRARYWLSQSDDSECSQ